MKFLAVFAALLAAAISYPNVKPWTLSQLENAVVRKEGDPAMQKSTEEAFNLIMYTLFTQTTEISKVHTTFLSPSFKRKWTPEEVMAESEDPSNMKYVIPYHKRSNDSDSDKIPQEMEFVVPAVDISTWTEADVSDAVEDPDTNPELQPYLEKAKMEFKEALDTEMTKDNVTLVTPVGLIPVKDGTKYRIVAFKKME